MRPVMPAAGDDTNIIGIDVNCEAVSIPFDLEKPVRADWRSGLQSSKAGLDPRWHRIKRQVGLPRIALSQAVRLDRMLECREQRGGFGQSPHFRL